MKKKLLPFILAFISIATMHSAKAQTYDPYDVQVINNLIANNGLNATLNAPETWTFATWNNENPKQIIELNFNNERLGGNASFAGLTTLQKLVCFDEPKKSYGLKELDLTNCTQLKYLNCYLNVTLNKLDLTNCTQLQSLNCGHNDLSELNLSDCTQLQSLICGYNKLTKLDLANYMQLQELECSGNNLTELDLTNCTQLQKLECFKNNLIELDLTSCTKLQSLICGFNKLTKLYLANCTLLQELYCNNNNLFELDLTGLDNLNIFQSAYQIVPLTLCKNEIGEYTHTISLNNPTFGNSAISYSNGILKSTDNTVSLTSFTIQTNKPGCELEGEINFSYSNTIINPQGKVQLKIYPNPTTGELRITNYEPQPREGQAQRSSLRINGIEVFDIMGRKVSSHHIVASSYNHLINISHLNSGIYFVKIDTEEGMLTKKIVKL